MRRTRILIAAALALLCLTPAAARAAEPGVVLSGDFFANPQTLDAVHRSGARWVRLYLYRDRMEIAPGVLSRPLLDAYRQTVARYLAAGVRSEIVLVGTPSWESGSGDPLVPPDPAGFAAFAREVSSQLPDVGAYEVWNEEDAAKWWHGQVDPTRYAQLLQATYPALKQGSGGADVLVGGLTGSDYPYLDALYANGAQGSFDGVDMHSDTACGLVSPYSYLRDPDGRISRWSFLGYREILKTMDAHGDAGKPIWFTELGWSTSAAVCDQGVWAGRKAGGVSEDQQAQYLAQAWHCLAAEPRVEGVFWFGLQDLGPDDTPDHRFGLLRWDGSGKPAFATFADIAANGDRLTGPCGDFAGPSIQVLALGDRGTTGVYRTALRVRVQASDPANVRHVVLYLDGARLKTFGGAHGPLLVGAASVKRTAGLAAGRHRLVVQASDANGNESAQTFTVVKERPRVRRAHHRRRHHHRRR